MKTAKFGWKTIWLTFMKELAPQSKDGAYTRPAYTFTGQIGSEEFPVRRLFPAVLIRLGRRGSWGVTGALWSPVQLESPAGWEPPALSCPLSCLPVPCRRPQAEPGRYHVYLGNACPWCHRVLLALALRGLGDGGVTFSRAADDPERASRGGWVFDEPAGDPIFGCRDLRCVRCAALCLIWAALRAA